MNSNQANIKKNCKLCGQEYTVNSNAHKRSKHCPGCRKKYQYIKRGGAEAQRLYGQKRLIEKYGIENLLKCKLCDCYFRQLGTHVVQVHKMTAKRYRDLLGVDRHNTKTTLVPELKSLYRDQALENKDKIFPNIIEGGKPTRYKKGSKTAGKYTRSKQTMARLKRHPSRHKTTLDECIEDAKKKSFPHPEI